MYSTLYSQRANGHAGPPRPRRSGRLPLSHRLVIGLVFALAHPGATVAGEKETTDTWTLINLDLDVALQPDRETLRTSGTMTLRCDANLSSALVLAMNGRDTVLEFVALEGSRVENAALNELDPEDAALRLARIELSEPAQRDEEIEQLEGERQSS